MSAHPRALALAAGAGAAAIALISAGGAGAGSGAHASACTPGLRGGVIYFCGPATARLGVRGSEVFTRRFVFRHGKCKHERVAGERQTTIEIGRIKAGDGRHNGGLPYIKIGISGPFSNPSSGYVIAYRQGKRWSGLGTSLKPDNGGWKFTASPTGGSRGRGSGRFHC